MEGSGAGLWFRWEGNREYQLRSVLWMSEGKGTGENDDGIEETVGTTMEPMLESPGWTRTCGPADGGRRRKGNTGRLLLLKNLNCWQMRKWIRENTLKRNDCAYQGSMHL